jgi:hypothetical protein
VRRCGGGRCGSDGRAQQHPGRCNHPIETRGTVTEASTFYSYTVDNPIVVPTGAGVGKISA